MKKRVFAFLLALCTLCLSGCGMLPSPFGNLFELPDFLQKPTEPAPTLPALPTVEATLPTEFTEETTMPEETVEPTIPAMQWPSDAPYLPIYWDAIQDFRSVISYRLSGNYNSDRMPQMSETTRNSISGDSLESAFLYMVEELSYGEGGDIDDFGYVLYDVNNDKVPELFWVRKDYSILAVFTVYKDKLKMLDASWSRYGLYVSSNGQLFGSGSSGASDSDTSVYIINKGKLQTVFTFGTESWNNYYGYRYFESTPNETMEISSGRASELYDQFPETACKYWKSTKLWDLEHVPEKGDAGAKRSSGTKYLPYTQKIKRADQSVYGGPSYKYDWRGTTEEVGTFTMTAQITDEKGNTWGRLKSSDGWINLTQVRKTNDQTLRLTASFVDPDLWQSNKFHYYYYPELDALELEDATRIAIYAYGTYTDVIFARKVPAGDFITYDHLYTLSKMDKKKPMVVEITPFGDDIEYAVFLTDSKGNQYIYDLRIDTSTYEPYMTLVSSP